MNRESTSTDLIVIPHPLTLEGRTITRAAELRPGDTLAMFLERQGVDLADAGWSVTIGGAGVPALMWGRTRPAHGQVIEVRRVAGKSALRLVAMLALAYVTLQLGLPGAYFGLQGFAAYAVNVAAFVLGSMVINRLLPPPQLKGGTYNNSTGTTYSLQGARNSARLFEPLGLVFGQVRVVPDFSAQPYSWFDGDDQYQYIRLHAGINCQSVSEVKIGETAIDTYQGVLLRESGFPGGSTQLLDWSAVDTIAGGLLDAATTAPGAWVVRTTSVGTTRIAIDLVAQLYALADDGAAAFATVSLEAERRLLPGGSFVPLMDAGVSLPLGSRTTTPLRRTFSVDVPEGQYEVRLRKTTVNVTSSRAANVVEWVALKSYQVDANDYADQPQVGIRIKASGQLNGTLDQVNWLATGRAADLWSGTAWSTVVTSNPGAHLLRFIRGIYGTEGRLMAGMGKPDSQIDMDSIKAFMVHCTAQGYRFDHWFDRAASCGEVLEAIASAGLGSVSYHAGKIGVVWAAADQPKEAVISPVRMKPGSFRVEYATRELADELEVTWPERTNGWLPASVRVKAPGVSIPRDTARLSPVGATTQATGLLAARWTMAQNIWQRRAVTWEMDLEHIAFHRFSMVALSHDVTQWGYSGRLQSAVNVAGVVTLTLDMEVPFNPGATSRHVALHLPGEQGYRVFGVAAFSGDTHTLTLTGSWPSGVALPGDSADNPAHDTVWLYDFAAEPGKRLRVVSIELTGNLSGARITAVPEPDEFWAYVAGGAYAEGAALAVAQAVVASNLRVSQLRADVNFDNTTELAISFDAAGPYDHAQVWGARSGDALVFLGETRTRLLTGWRVPNDGVFAIEVRPFDGLGRPGNVLTATYSVALGQASGRSLRLNATSQVFAIANDGSGTPSSITFTATTQNLGGVPVMTVLAGSVSALGGSGGSRTLAASAMLTDSVTIQVAQDGLTDTVTVVKVRDGSTVIWGGLSNEAHTVATAADGSGGDYTTAGGTFALRQGATLLTSGVTYSVVSGSVSGISGLSINSAGVYSLTGTTADVGVATLRAAYGSVYVDAVYSISRAKAGAAGSNGSNGTNGTNGTNGLSNALVHIYQRSASGAPALPSATATYTFGTASLTGLNNGWSGVPPAGTDPLYVSVATASAAGTSDTIAAGEWATAVLMARSGSDGSNGTNGSNGADGINSATVFLFQRTTGAAPSLPSTATTYMFATGVAAGHNNGWTQTMPTTGGAYRWTTTATALSTGATDSIAAGEWAAVSLLAQDGAAGSNGSNGTNGLDGASTQLEFSVDGSTSWHSTFTTGDLFMRTRVGTGAWSIAARIVGEAGSAGADGNYVDYIFKRAASIPGTPSGTGVPSGWAGAPPAADGNPLWMSKVTKTSAGALVGAWSVPVQLDGARGTDGTSGVSTANLLVYQRSTSGAPALPSATVTYTFAGGGVSGLNNGWTTTVPTGAGALYMTQATASGTGATDTIGAGEWAAAVLLAASDSGVANSIPTLYAYSDGGTTVSDYSRAALIVKRNGDIGTNTWGNQYGVGDGSNYVKKANWYTPTTTGAGDAYYIKCSMLSGANNIISISQSARDTWLALSSDRYWQFGVSGTAKLSHVVLVQIATDALGANVVASFTAQLEALTEAP